MNDFLKVLLGIFIFVTVVLLLGYIGILALEKVSTIPGAQNTTIALN